MDIKNFFQSISIAVIKLVNESNAHTDIVEDKVMVGDYSTKVDIDTENLIVQQIKKYYPNDEVLAEEGHSETEISEGRIWLIDPICGTNNLGKGISNFCTNLALVERGKVIASCVVDHSRKEYMWSEGDGTVFIGQDEYSSPPPKLGLKVDVDFGSVRNTAPDMRAKHNKLLLKLVNDTDYDLISLNTSLGFAYTAVGKVDGFINLFNHPWDIAASSFLIQQAGGIITALDGSAWTVSTVGAIAGRTTEIHQNLLSLYSQA